jgi:hypothetical protein
VHLVAGNLLLLDGNAHLELTHQLNVLQLVVLSHLDVSAVLLQFAHLGHAELLDLEAERQVIAECVDVILDEIDQALVECVVLALHVGVLDLDAENVLVESAREVALEEFVVVDCFGWKLRGKS